MDDVLTRQRWLLYPAAHIGLWVTLLAGAIACHRRQRRRTSLILAIGASVSLLTAIVSAIHQLSNLNWQDGSFFSDPDAADRYIELQFYMDCLFYGGALVFAVAFLSVATSSSWGERPENE